MWAYRTAKSLSTRASSFSLVYGMKAVIPIDLVKLVVKLVEISGVSREATLEIVEEKYDNATFHNHLYQANMKARYESQVKERRFQVGNFFWKTTPHV